MQQNEIPKHNNTRTYFMCVVNDDSHDDDRDQTNLAMEIHFWMHKTIFVWNDFEGDSHFNFYFN